MEEKIRRLIDNESIRDVITDLFISTDSRDWEAVQRCFAERVLFTTTSKVGDKPTVLSPGQITAAWKEGLKSIEAIHHQVGNFKINVQGTEAHAFCYGIASHYLAGQSNGNTRIFVGSYDFHLQQESGRWRIDRFTFNLKYADGNLELGAE